MLLKTSGAAPPLPLEIASRNRILTESTSLAVYALPFAETQFLQLHPACLDFVRILQAILPLWT